MVFLNIFYSFPIINYEHFNLYLNFFQYLSKYKKDMLISVLLKILSKLSKRKGFFFIFEVLKKKSFHQNQKFEMN